MRTSKAISTISFNSASFLKGKLSELQKSGIISFWCFIEHKPEDDEGGKKSHIHLYIEPSKMIQTDSLKSEFLEYDSEHPDKPKGCISFYGSKWADWYLYSLHDRRYLAQKGQSRKFHYNNDNFVCSDDDDFLYKVKSIDLVALSPYADMLDAQRNGVSWEQYFARGTVPLNQVLLFQHAWELLKLSYTYRNGKENHPLDVDTGEILE